MKIKVYKDTTNFSYNGDEIEITIECKNHKTLDMLHSHIQGIDRDAGISSTRSHEEITIWETKND